jgi:hypothetical protein|tara:strand:- start:53 stop:229 length:177 start_codon:yes stop_codon:yes gene_type:complete
MIKVKMIMVLSVDEEEYHIPSDGRLGEEIEDYIKDLIHEVDGLKITSMKLISEDINYV